MTAWWQAPYPGGIVPVPGFPRELEPGAPDGTDVVAWKRFCWQMGRWPGPATRFDDTYSKAFATGQGPNVIDTGVAGVQRQLGYPDTGKITEAFFDDCRTRHIPDGLPNAGQFGFDANAANLLAEAYARFAAPPVAPPKASTREFALEGAISWLGYTESPAGSNNTKFGDWYGMNYQPWCAMFATWCFLVEAGGSPSFAKGTRYAYCPYIVQDARNGQNGLTVTSTPIPGDLVTYDWDGGGADHVGIFEDGNASSWTAIEGNTSTSNQSNGGQVMRRQRSSTDAAVVFVRVAEP